MARLIDADKFRQWWLENGENEYVYDTNSVLDSIDNWPTFILSQEPLTLEQLRKMDRFSPPIYDIYLNTWCCVRENACAGDIGVSYIGGGTRPLEEGRFYPYPLPHIDREAWICGICEVPSHWAKWGNLGYRYCPHCGRPLTEEAWAELERRLIK